MLLWITNCLLLRHVAVRSRSEKTCLFYTCILIFSRENYEHGMQLFMFYVRVFAVSRPIEDYCQKFVSKSKTFSC